MPYLSTYQPFRIPKGLVPLNPRYPRPVCVWTPTHQDLVSGQPWTKVTTSSDEVPSNFEYGSGDLFRGGTAYVLPLSTVPYFAPPATVLVAWRWHTASSPIFSFGGSGFGRGWIVGGNATPVYRATWGGVADYVSSVTIKSGPSVAAFGLGGSGSNYDLVVDGVYRQTVSTPGTIQAPDGSATPPNSRACVASFNDGAVGGVQSYLGVVAVWAQRFPVSMLMELTRAPALLFGLSVLRPTFVSFSAFKPAWAMAANQVVSSGARVA